MIGMAEAVTSALRSSVNVNLAQSFVFQGKLLLILRQRERFVSFLEPTAALVHVVSSRLLITRLSETSSGNKYI